MKLGYNGVKTVSKRLGIHEHIIRRGKRELERKTLPPANKIRQKGEGRKKTAVVKDLIEILLLILSSFTAGNPVGINKLWTNLTYKDIQEELTVHFISVSCPVIKKIMTTQYYT
jgi:transposase